MLCFRNLGNALRYLINSVSSLTFVFSLGWIRGQRSSVITPVSYSSKYLKLFNSQMFREYQWTFELVNLIVTSFPYTPLAIAIMIFNDFQNSSTQQEIYFHNKLKTLTHLYLRIINYFISLHFHHIYNQFKVARSWKFPPLLFLQLSQFFWSQFLLFSDGTQMLSLMLQLKYH